MRLFRSSVSHPDGELRYGLTTHRGEVEEFVVQLYHRNDRWRIVCQFDHTPAQSMGHDVTVEGIHLDLFDNDGNKVNIEYADHPGPCDPAFALNYARNFLKHRNEQLIRRWPTWR